MLCIPCTARSSVLDVRHETIAVRFFHNGDDIYLRTSDHVAYRLRSFVDFPPFAMFDGGRAHPLGAGWRMVFGYEWLGGAYRGGFD
jgi:hypothetical protein